MYIEELKRHIDNIISTKNFHSYDEVFKASKGAFPDVVFPLLKKYSNIDSIKASFYGLKEVSNIIPESNPINYDWRFDISTIKKIVTLVKNKRFTRIALFGTPSLFAPLSKKIRNLTLFDINETLINHFNNDKRVVITDLNMYDFENFIPFDCIIMDPPWYLNYYNIWLQKGNSVLKSNGYILITLFQELLRPKAKKELKSIKQLANKIGDYEIKENFVNYITPLFEKELFNYENIPCYGNWRNADLLIIKKDTSINLPELKKIKRNNWVRLEIGTQTIAINIDKNKNEKISVKYPYRNKDSLIKSVSDRDLIRRKLNFVTSRNRGLIITGSNKVIAILRAISEGVSKNKVFKENNLTSKEGNSMQKVLDTIFI